MGDGAGRPRIVEITTREEALSLTPLLTAYVTFICDDLKRTIGFEVAPSVLIEMTLSHIDDVVPPRGRTFAAIDGDDVPYGMVFLRPCGSDGMEIKRLYVDPRVRGTGAGRALIEAGLSAAKNSGAVRLRLDSTRNLEGALALYRGYGFVEIPPFPESDLSREPALAHVAVFMEKRLLE